MNATKEHTFRCGYVAIIGRPNVGKSTLLNNFLHFKLSIVTPKPQTTRNRILGIYTSDTAQSIFLDTPGLLEPKYRLHELLVRAAHSAAEDADVLLYVTEATANISENDNRSLEQLRQFKKPVVVCINKIDLIEKRLLLPQIEGFSRIDGVQEIIPVSALQNDGIDELIATLEKYLPFSPPLYPPDQLATAPERFFVAEIIREKIFLHYGEEIPYSAAVVIEEFKERSGRKDYIRAAIWVERPSQKAILIGKNGEALKKVGTQAREEIEAFLGRPVFLELVVLVREHWRQNERLLRELGY